MKKPYITVKMSILRWASQGPVMIYGGGGTERNFFIGKTFGFPTNTK